MVARKSTGEALQGWEQLRFVLALARHGTLSAAARALAVDHTTVARRVEALERDLGRPLFERGPDGFATTPLGETVRATAERIEAELGGLARQIDGSDPSLTGTVRLTTTGWFAAHLFVPALPAFRRRHPGLTIELIGDNRAFDLPRREADLAVRMGEADSPEIVARRIAGVAFACYAAAGDPRPFEAQDFLSYDDGAAGMAQQRYLLGLIPSSRIVLRANALLTLRAAALAGVGCAVLPCFAAEGEPGLRRVPAPRAMPVRDLWLLYHADLRRSPRLRAAVEFVDQAVAAQRGALMPAGFPFDPADDSAQRRHG